MENVNLNENGVFKKPILPNYTEVGVLLAFSKTSVAEVEGKVLWSCDFKFHHNLKAHPCQLYPKIAKS